MIDQTDLLVIGGGPGGYVAAIRGGQLGLNVTLVEKDAVGGTCLNYGCIPSKAMLSATKIADDARTASNMGIHAELSIEMGELIGWKDGVIAQLTDGVGQLCRANGVGIVEGRARFVDATTAVIDGPEGTNEIGFQHAIVATGSRPIKLPGFDFDDETVLDSRAALSLEDAPSSLLVVGAGYIGMELATVFSKLGTEITVVEKLEGILPSYANELTEPVYDRALELGIDFNFGEGATGWYTDGNDIIVTTEGADGSERRYEVDKVLVAVGREPVTDTVAIENAGVVVDKNGFIRTDRQQVTAVESVFAVGDVSGEPMLAHKASAEGVVAAENAAGRETSLDQTSIPSVVFTDPEIATVGMDTKAVKESELSVTIGQFPFRANGRALTSGTVDGFVNVIAEEDSGILVGAQIVGRDASELIAELGLAIEVGATLKDIARTIHAHPTLSEAVKESAEHALGHAIHTVNR